MKKIEITIDYDKFDPCNGSNPYSAWVVSKEKKFSTCTIGKSIKDVKDQMRAILKERKWKENEYRFKYYKIKSEPCNIIMFY